MTIEINGTGTVTGISVGGLPDGIVDTDMLAANAVTEAKLGSDQQQGLAKAWVNFNGTSTVAIRDSFNVSSITDNGTGDYVVNFTNAMVNTNYVAIASCNSIGSVNSSTNATMVFARSAATNVSPSTTSMACCAYHPANSVNQDVSYYTVAVFGD